MAAGVPDEAAAVTLADDGSLMTCPGWITDDFWKPFAERSSGSVTETLAAIPLNESPDFTAYVLDEAVGDEPVDFGGTLITCPGRITDDF